jgi:hypothetical protein
LSAAPKFEKEDLPKMKIRIATLSALLALGCLVALGADIDGKWMSEAPAGGKGGPQTLTLKSAGEKLTGSMEGGRGGAVEITEGMVHGADVMFKVVREFGGNKITQSFNGKLAGTELKLTVEGGGGKGKGPGEITFKKQ